MGIVLLHLWVIQTRRNEKKNYERREGKIFSKWYLEAEVILLKNEEIGIYAFLSPERKEKKKKNPDVYCLSMFLLLLYF